MKMRAIFTKAIILIGLCLFAVIAFQMIRTLFIYAGNSTKIILYYAFFILFACAFAAICLKYKLKTLYKLIGLIVISFLVQFIFSIHVHLAYEGDLKFYFDNAVNFSQNGFNERLLYNSLFPTTATYPAFLVPFMKLFGPHPMIPVLINQLSMTGLSCLVYFFCKRILPESFALAAAFSICLHPFTIIYSNTCNAELIFGTLVLAGFFAMMKAKEIPCQRFKIALAALAGLLCGLSNLFRPLGIIMLIALLIYIIFFSREKLRFCLILAAALLLPYILAQFGNQALQKQITKYPPPSNGYGWNLYVGASPTGRWNQADADLFASIVKASDSPSEVQKYFAKEGIKRYLELGLQAIPHSLRKLAPWNAIEYMANEAARQEEQSPFYSANQKGTYLTLITLVDFPMFILALLSGLWVLLSSLKTKEHELAPLVLYLLGSFLVLMIMEIAPRYTVSYRPIFCILAIYGIHALMVNMKKLFTNKNIAPEAPTF